MILIENIYKKFEEDNVIENFSFHIKSEEFVAIMGPSGSGKSTILNIIGGLDKPTSGNITIDNIKNPWENRKNKTKILRYTIGYLFQNYALIENKTVSANLDIALKYNKVKDKDKLKRDILKKVGLEEKLNTKVYKLSGGEQQRVAIARLFLKPCKVILADEPTASLDEENKKNILFLLHELNKTYKKTILIVTHDKFIGDSANRIIYLDKQD